MGARLRWAWQLLSSAGLVFAAPVLRLSNTVAIVQVSVGASPPVLTLEAYNAGDGTLSPGVSVPPEVPWLTASVGGACPEVLWSMLNRCREVERAMISPMVRMLDRCRPLDSRNCSWIGPLTKLER